ncbi:hypothetical protein [Yersinia proxima]|uniref:hypothetical protein n=1 Tax=Yersinia proxima TaxID=2890316 RepID=UPI001D123945|nr:hypothetical protein [Yersinia proxima]
MLSKEQLEKIANPAQADIGGTQSPIITQMAIELLESRAESLSLREQVAELKALQPVAEMRTWPKNISGPNPDWFWFGKQDFPVGTQLFTAAKPAENDIAKFMAGVKRSMAQGVAEAIQKDALQIMFDEITPDTETVAMQYESLVKRINRPEGKPDEPM